MSSLSDEEVLRFNVALGKLETIVLPGLDVLFFAHCTESGFIYPKGKRWMKSTLEKSTKTELWQIIDTRVAVTWPEASKLWKQNDNRFKDLKRAVKALCDLAWISYETVLRTRTYFA